MSLWRKLFPKYNCRRCRDTFVVSGLGYIARCDCPASKEATGEAMREFAEHLERVATQQRLRNFAEKLKP